MTTGAPSVVRRSMFRPGGQRGFNLGLALRCVAKNSGRISRADISASTGLNRSTASSLVDELIAGGLIREVGVTARVGVGRPPTVLALTEDGPAGLGLDINVDYVSACVVDLTGQVRYQYVVVEDQRGRSPEAVLGRAGRLGQEARASVAGSGLEPWGTAVAIPGLVSRPGRTLAIAPNLGWHDLDVVGLLRSQGLDDRITLDNEGNFAALSEDELLGGDQSYLYVYGQIGVGAGVVIDGELYSGRHGWGGEVGHLLVDQNGPICHCGQHGCLEQYAGHEAILRAACVQSPPGSAAGARSTAVILRERADGGDSRTLAALARAGTSLGVVLAGCLNLLDVDRIVLGGIYRDLSRWIIPEIRREMSARFIGARWLSPIIQTASAGAEAPALGAARSVVRDIVTDPVAWLSR